MPNFDEYKKLGEPNKREKSVIWETAIGLQDVDGLKASGYLIETAKANIEGDITFEEVKSRIDNYYKISKETKKDDSRTEEADKVSARIAEILSEKTFSFNVTEYITIHKRLFEDFDFGGKIRDYDISKEEWVLDGESVFYASWQNIKETLEYDFKEERSFSYRDLSKNEKTAHISDFISRIWQVHPFGEGNTRATAVFAIKYLRTLGFNVENDMFAEHSWYFRNALVRANFSNHTKDVYKNGEFLENFFENLLLNAKHPLKNRVMHISLDKDYDTINTKNDTLKTENDTLNNQILCWISKNDTITAQDISDKLQVSLSTVKRRIKQLKEAEAIKRVGSKKAGKWEICQ